MIKKSVRLIKKMLRYKKKKQYGFTNLVKFPESDRSNRLPLDQWLVSFFKEQRYQDLIHRFANRKATSMVITSIEETAMLYALIEYLRPRLCLEIGSFFCNSTHIMAEAFVDNKIKGQITTIDPYGKKRVPHILKTWPKKLQRIVHYKPFSSMQYFLTLEDLDVTKGNQSPLGLVFVDGHHNFEYAFYDIMRSADHLQPGGAIVIDNLEQDGPKTAVIQFLHANPAWKFFRGGSLLTAKTIDTHSDSWGVLISPNGTQIARQFSKFNKRFFSQPNIRRIRLNLEKATHQGFLSLNMSYYSNPVNYHKTGVGLIDQRVQRKIAVSPTARHLDVIFDPPLECGALRKNVHVNYEMELSYQSDDSADAYLLLDVKEPLAFT